MIRVKAWNDLFFGLFLVGCGAAALYFLAGLSVGSATRMGPGYVPGLLGLTVVGLGVLIVLRSFLQEGEAPEAWSLRSLTAVVAAILLFTFVERIGFGPAVAGTTLIACLGDRQTRWSQAVILAACLAVFSSVVFVKLLGLPFPLLPQF